MLRWRSGRERATGDPGVSLVRVRVKSFQMVASAELA